MKKLYVVDLDGTLVNANSLHFFISALIKAPLEIKTIYSFYMIFKVILFVVLRKIRLCSHDRMKQEFQKIWHDFEIRGYKPVFEELTEQYLDKVVRKDVLNFIANDRSRDDLVLLATAAPSEYVEIMVMLLPIIDKYVATPRINEGEWYHNIAENKWDSIIRAVDIKDTEIISFTDHADDLPLIKNSHRAYLFLPLSNDIASLQKQYKNVVFMKFYE